MRVRLLALGPIISVAAMLNVCGGQWLVLQSVAWTGMLIKYSQQDGLAQAVAETFDGDHPCDICKGIQREKATDEEENVPIEKQWDMKFFVSPRARTLYPPASFDLQPVISQETLTWADAPPVPPPRNTVS
jgi:hypothetical protein